MDPTDDQNPYRSPLSQPDGDIESTVLEVTPKYRREKRRVILLILVVYAIGGVILGASPADLYDLLQLATSFISILLVLRWCEYDRQERHLERWKHFGILMVLFAGIVLPIYFLRTRGVRGFLSIAKAFGLFVVAAVVSLLAELAVSWAP